VTDIFGGGGKFFLLLEQWEKGPVWMKLPRPGRAGATEAGRRRRTPRRGWRGRWRGWRSSGAARLTEPVREMLRVAARGRILADLESGDAPRGGAKRRRRWKPFGARFPEIDPLLRNTYA